MEFGKCGKRIPWDRDYDDCDRPGVIVFRGETLCERHALEVDAEINNAFRNRKKDRDEWIAAKRKAKRGVFKKGAKT